MAKIISRILSKYKRRRKALEKREQREEKSQLLRKKTSVVHVV